MKFIMFLLFLFSFMASGVFAASVSIDTYPSYIAADGTPFAVKVVATDFTDGVYDVKVDMVNASGDRIGQVWNHSTNTWRSSYYYVNGLLIVSGGSGYAWVYIKVDYAQNFVGIANISARLRSGGGTTYDSQQYLVSVMNMTTDGGWVQGNLTRNWTGLQGKTILLKNSTGSVFGSYITENNSIEDYNSSDQGYYKLAAKIGTSYSLYAYDTDGSLINSTTGIDITGNAVTNANIAILTDGVVIRDLIAQDITFSPTSPEQGDNVTITALVKNNGSTQETSVEVQFYNNSMDEGSLISTVTMQSINAGQIEEASIVWNNTLAGNHTIYVNISYISGETNTTNNVLSKNITIGEETVIIAAAENITLIYPSSVEATAAYNVTVNVTGFIDGNYDVKVDITDANGNRIGNIWDNGWKSSIYYISTALSVMNGTGQYQIQIKTDNYAGDATIVAKVRSGDSVWSSRNYNITVTGVQTTSTNQTTTTQQNQTTRAGNQTTTTEEGDNTVLIVVVIIIIIIVAYFLLRKKPGVFSYQQSYRYKP